MLSPILRTLDAVQKQVSASKFSSADLLLYILLILSYIWLYQCELSNLKPFTIRTRNNRGMRGLIQVDNLGPGSEWFQPFLHFLCETRYQEEQSNPSICSTKFYSGFGLIDKTKSVLIRAGTVTDIALLSWWLFRTTCMVRSSQDSYPFSNGSCKLLGTVIHLWTIYHRQERLAGCSYKTDKLHRKSLQMMVLTLK